MKWIKFIPVAALTLPMAGCLTCETIETHIQLRERGEPIITIEYVNISSGEAYTSDVRKDFEQLLSDWHDDQYLLDRDKEGLLVKNREVFFRDGKIVGRVTGIPKNLQEMYRFWTSNGERIMLVDLEEGEEGDYKLVDTNGKILKTEENTLIVWPANASELRWKQRESKPSESSAKNRSLMVKLLEEHLAGQAKTSTKP